MDRAAGSGAGWRRRRPTLLLLVAVALALGLVAGCSNTTSSASTSSSAPAPAQASATTWTPPVCHRPVAAPVPATPVSGVPSDWTITSFDGTKIRAHWFPVAGASAAHPAPTVLMGPGWGESGDTDQTGTGDALLGGIDISALHGAGYNVLTWDPRGFGDSTGLAEVDSPAFEAKDVSRLIDWVATRPGVQLDAPGDPRMGMVGGSYGGGIQWVTAAQDCRIDAIVPIISWHSLGSSLLKTGLYKAGWGNLLVDAAASDHLDPHVRAAAAVGNATGTTTPSNVAWFLARGPGDLVKDIHIPTLIVQGTVDTLFTLDEGITNYAQVKKDGVPVSMLWFCGGHGVCLTSQGNPLVVQDASIAWLNRWVKRDPAVDTGPLVDIIDQNGVRYAADTYPLPTVAPLSATGNGTLPLVATGGSGPVTLAPTSPASANPLASVVPGILPARATNAVNLRVGGTPRTSLVVGAPTLTLTYRGSTPPGVRPTRIFAQLVDNTTGLVVGNQVTPVVVVLDGREHTTTVSLEAVCQSVVPGQTLTLQLVATTVAYATPRLGGSVDFSNISVRLPVVVPSAVTVTSRS